MRELDSFGLILLAIAAVLILIALYAPRPIEIAAIGWTLAP